MGKQSADTGVALPWHRQILMRAGLGLALGVLVVALMQGLPAPAPQDRALAALPDHAAVALAPAAKASASLHVPTLAVRDSSTPVATAPQSAWPKVAIVIDDLGLNHAKTLRAIALKGPLTLAFLPYGHGLGGLAARARAAGHELFVHLPMEPKQSDRDPGPHALRVGMAPAALAHDIAWNLGRFDGFVGVNNHMGSRFTEDSAAMAQLFDALRARGLAFLDSRTTAQSAGPWLAVRRGLAYGERDVFLDNERAAPALDAQLAELERRARAQGTAIAIGHPHAVTLAALESWIAALPEKRIALVPVSAIIHARGSPLWRLAYDRGVAVSQLAPGSK
ncbi:MAG: divergent polysaccharide deacetylase family protein [Alphaproteobacteria bacterium]|nr:MAG: divergent polysaccharide deacetylase family protein [Alphaproteobacteria bacterium]